jgi:hypothetical protein
MKNSKPSQKTKPTPNRIPRLSKADAKPKKFPTPSPLPEISENYHDNTYYNAQPNLDDWDVDSVAASSKPMIPTNYDSMLKRYNINRGSPPLYVKERKVRLDSCCAVEFLLFLSRQNF